MLSAETWLTRFVQQLKIQGFSELSIPDYVHNIRRFLEYLEARGIDRLTEVDRRILAYYQLEVSLENFRGKPLRSSTQRKRLTCVRQFFRYLLKQSAVLQNITSELQFPRLLDQLPRDVLTKREVGRLLSADDPESLLGLRDRSMLELLYSTGMRRRELANLNLSDFSFERGELLIVNPKGKRDRLVLVGEAVRQFTKAYLRLIRPWIVSAEEEKALFVNHRGGGRLSLRSVSKIVHRAAQANGVKKRISPHSFRHAMATHLLRNHANLRHIQALLGHAQITSTELYTHLSPEDLKEAVRRLRSPTATGIFSTRSSRIPQNRTKTW